MAYWGERKSIIQYANYTNEVKLDAFTDINLGIEYRYKKHISAFVNFNNLANNSYQRWYNYPVYGFNLLGGFNFTF
jgi:outer membrane receptor protein involved in Fe transport